MIGDEMNGKKVANIGCSSIGASPHHVLQTLGYIQLLARSVVLLLAMSV